MKIVSLLGSPRKKGSSSTIAEMVVEKIGGAEDEVISHHLNSLDFKGCQACRACKTKSEVCILRDDLAEVLQDVSEADVIIMATPVYWGEVSSQMKGFIDRTYSYLTPNFMTDEIKHRLPSGKKLVFIKTQGAPEMMYGDVFERYNSFFKSLNIFEEAFLIRGCTLDNESKVREISSIKDKVNKVGKAIKV